MDVTFVMQPTAFDGVAGFLSKIPDVPGTHQKKIGAITGSDIRVNVIVPNQLLSTYRVAGAELGRRVPVAVPSVSWSRYGDAVAAAGYELGSSPRRRAVVLVLNRFDRLNASTFDAGQARAYLSEVLVPLLVWRIGPEEVGPEWPEGKVITSLNELRDAFESLVHDVERQRIAWLEGTRDLRFAGPRVSAGIGLAGRIVPDQTMSPGVADATGEPAVAVGPEGGDVHALASAREGAVLLAGTHAGVFRSKDGGRQWEPARRGLPPGPVRSLALSEDAAIAFAANDAGLFRTEDAGGLWSAVAGPGAPSHPTRVALDGGRSGRVYVGTRGEGVLRSDDGGKTFLRTLLDGGDVRALAVDRERRVVWAATEQGLFRSADQAASWNSVSGIPSAVTAARRRFARPDLRRDGWRWSLREQRRRSVMGTDEARSRVSDGRGGGLRGSSRPRRFSGRSLLVLRWRQQLEARPHRSRRGALPGRLRQLGRRRSSRSPPSRACLKELDTLQQRTRRDIGVFSRDPFRIARIGPCGNGARNLPLRYGRRVEAPPRRTRGRRVLRDYASF